MQQTVHAKTARTVTLFLHFIEVSHISISKTSITLRVSISRRHKIRIKNHCKDSTFFNKQAKQAVFLNEFAGKVVPLQPQLNKV